QGVKQKVTFAHRALGIGRVPEGGGRLASRCGGAPAGRFAAPYRGRLGPAGAGQAAEGLVYGGGAGHGNLPPAAVRLLTSEAMSVKGVRGHRSGSRSSSTGSALASPPAGTQPCRT